MAKEDKDKEEEIISDEDLISDLKDLLDKTEKEKQDYFNGWQREKADFINYKNKEFERLGNIIENIKQDFILEILPIVDNLNRAENAIAPDKKQDQNIKGLLMIKNQLEQVLNDEGLEKLERLNKRFDPSLDEVVEVVDAQKDKEPELVVEEVEKGYRFRNKIIRPAKVKISK
ncbi:MAG: nucleotide exchange factor GrpE [Candidatus Paceibacterota bacterium]